MKKYLACLILALSCADCLYAKTYHISSDKKARPVFKEYVDYKGIWFRDSHFRFYDAQGKMVILTSIRADDGGVFYYEKDCVKKKGKKSVRKKSD